MRRILGYRFRLKGIKPLEKKDRVHSEKPKEDLLEVEGSVSCGIGYLWEVMGTKAGNANLSKQSEDAYPTTYHVHVFSEHHGGP